MSATENFRKAILLHAPRTMFYDDDYLDKTVGKTHSPAMRALEKWIKKAKEDPELYHDVLIELTKHEDPRVQYAAAISCLKTNIEPDYAIELLYKLKLTPNISPFTRMSIGICVGMYKKGTLQ